MEKTLKFIDWLREKKYCTLSPQFIKLSFESDKKLLLEKLYWLFDCDNNNNTSKNFKETYINPYVKNKYDSNGVTKPIQYQIGIDTFQRSESNLSKQEIIAICKFNIDKYCWRKKDQDKDDFKKIIDYANWAIKNL